MKCVYCHRHKSKESWRGRRAQVGMDRALIISQRKSNQRGRDTFCSYSFSPQVLCMCASGPHCLLSMCAYSLLLSPPGSTSYIYSTDIVFVNVLFSLFWKEMVFRTSKAPSLQSSARISAVCVCVFVFLKSEKDRNMFIRGSHSD